MRTKSALLLEATGLGVQESSITHLSKEKIEDLIARLKDPQGNGLLQIWVMLAHDLKDTEQSKRDAILSDSHWVAEEKLDGVRMKVHVTKDGLRLDGRRRSDETYRFVERTANFPHLANFTAFSVYEGMVLDAELMMLNQSIDTGAVVTAGTLTSTTAVTTCAPDKSIALQERWGKARLFVFDIVRGPGGKPMVATPFKKRRAALEKLWVAFATELNLAGIELTEQSVDKKGLFESVCSRGGEGVMLKDLEAPYLEGKRTRSMLKWKKIHTLDGVITGYVTSTEGKGFENLVGALEVSVTDLATKKLRVIAAVQPGTLEFRKEISTPQGTLRGDMLGKVVEVRGNEWTKNLRLRHAVLMRFRPDKSAEDCVVDFSGIKAGSSEA